MTRVPSRFSGNSRQRRRIAAADVLGEGGSNGLTDFCGGQFHAAKMASNERQGKAKTRRRAIPKAI